MVDRNVVHTSNPILKLNSNPKPKLNLNLIEMLYPDHHGWKEVGFPLYVDLCAILFSDYMSRNLHECTSLFALISEEMFSNRDADCIWALRPSKMQMHSVRRNTEIRTFPEVV